MRCDERLTTTSTRRALSAPILAPLKYCTGEVPAADGRQSNIFALNCRRPSSLRVRACSRSKTPRLAETI